MLATLLADQCGIVTRGQLRQVGVTDDYVKAQARAHRWRVVNEVVVCTHNGPLTLQQSRWAAVLSAPGLVALSGLTCLESHGVSGLESPAVHVLIPKGARVVDVPDIQLVVHESRRFSGADVLPRLPPLTTIERAAVDAAVWSSDIRTATRILTAPVQQRRAAPGRLREELIKAGRVRFRGILLPFVADLEGGAEALSEVAFLRWCRRHKLPEPETKVRLDGRGRRRYLDATFRTAAGRELFVEIDGGIHLTLTTRWADTAKDNDAVLANRTTLRFPSIAIYVDDSRALAQLREALGVVRNNGRDGAR